MPARSCSARRRKLSESARSRCSAWVNSATCCCRSARVSFLDIERTLQGLAGPANQSHYVAIALAGGAQNTDVTAIGKGASEAADNQTAASPTANRVFLPDIYTQWLVRCSFIQPRLQVV